MIDKVAAPFWLIWAVGLAIGFVTGNEIPWILGGAVVGLVVGFMLAAKAKRDRDRAFRGRGAIAAQQRAAIPMPSTQPPSEIDSAA